MLINDEIDIGLIPVAAIPKLKNWHIVSDYCIGANGAVASVCIFSQVAMEEIETVYLDYQSRTSVSLAKILLRDYWKKNVVFIEATGEDFRSKIASTTAAVIIGDRALQQRQHSKYIYDLAAAWKEHTGLPFVFAAWIANKQLPEGFEERFNEANERGVAAINTVISQNPNQDFDLKKYYLHHLSYKLTPTFLEGMEVFLERLKTLR